MRVHSCTQHIYSLLARERKSWKKIVLRVLHEEEEKEKEKEKKKRFPIKMFQTSINMRESQEEKTNETE